MCADIAMCEGKSCPLKDNCYRHLAIENEFRQSYFAEPPFKDGECEYFWPIKRQLPLRKPKEKE